MTCAGTSTQLRNASTQALSAYRWQSHSKNITLHSAGIQVPFVSTTARAAQRGQRRARHRILRVGRHKLPGVPRDLAGGSSIVGRRLGAGDPIGAVQGAMKAIPWTLAAGGLASLLFRFGAPTLCGAFTHAPAVLVQAELYARTLAWSQRCVAVEALAAGVLAGGAGWRRRGG